MHTTNKMCHMVYRLLPFSTTLNDLVDNSSVARLLKSNSTKLCVTIRTVSTDTVRRAVHRRQQSFLSLVGHGPLGHRNTHITRDLLTHILRVDR